MKRSALLVLCFAAALGAPAAPALADQPSVHTGLLSNVGVGGYDPVAYFTQGAAVRGSPQFRATHRNVE